MQLQWLQLAPVATIAGVITGQKTDTSALEFTEVTPWLAECRTDNTSCLSEGGTTTLVLAENHTSTVIELEINTQGFW